MSSIRPGNRTPMAETQLVENGDRDKQRCQALSELAVRFLPLAIFLVYLTFTVWLFAYGPWPWPVVDGGRLYAFLSMAHVALVLGYLTGARGNGGGYNVQWSFQRLVGWSLAANLIMFIPTSWARTGHLIPDVLAGLTNPGAAYGASLAWRAANIPVGEYGRILVGPLLNLLLPLSIYYWRSLKISVRILSVLSLLGTITIFVSMGTNKAIADMILVVPWMIIAGHFAGHVRLNRRHFAGLALAVVVALVLFMGFFTAGQITRSGSGAPKAYFPYTRMYADTDNALIRLLPPKAKIGAIALSSYLTQGYYGLYLALDKPFVPMYGVGNSMFLTHNAIRLTGDAALQSMPYPARLQGDGWDPYVCWSSIYPWLASDVSFPGVILLMFLIGRLVAMAWVDSVRGKNPFAVVAFSQFAIMLSYFPANNQLLQDGESLVSFFSILILWQVTRVRFVWRQSRDE